MQTKSLLTKILAVVGTLLAWLPLLAPVFFSFLSLVARGRFRFDYLMPAEFFPVALLGGGLLLWAALRAHTRLPIIAWGLGVAVGLLVGGQALAVVTGLASGETQPTGIGWALVIASLVLYTVALGAVAVGGSLLVRDLFKKQAAAG